MGKKTGSPIHIAFITDNNYVIPTSIALSSIIETREPSTSLCIHVVCASLSAEIQDIFNSFVSDNVEIDIIIQDADRFLSLHQVVKCVASRAALLKFVLPELLPNCKRVLYLDGDILVKSDLSELYNVDLANNYAACVLNSFTFFRKHYPYEDTVENYFNSGVMVLNLQLMREDNITSQLIETKSRMQDITLMDQVVFNYVFDKRISLLPLRYNFQILCMPRVKDDEGVRVLNEHFGTQYCNMAELLSDTVVVHFASRAKPWNTPTTPLSDEWYMAYLRSPVQGKLPPLSQIFSSQLEFELGNIRNSRSYRIGRTVTWLPRMTLNGIRRIKKGLLHTRTRLLVHLHLKEEAM